MNFFKLYIGDYQRDTGTLSLAEHGAYLLMMQHLYATERPLPIGRDLYRLLRADSEDERAAIDRVVSRYWIETPQGLVSERCSEELDKARAQAETNRRIAAEREARKPTNRPTGAETNRATNRSTVGSTNRTTNRATEGGTNRATNRSTVGSTNDQPNHSQTIPIVREGIPPELSTRDTCVHAREALPVMLGLNGESLAAYERGEF